MLQFYTSFIDALLPEAHVLIEQKSASHDLLKKVKQSDGSTLSPFAQAVRYDENLPLSRRARYIVICNFKQFAIYDREQPHTPPEVIKLEDLSDNLERLSFLTNIGDGQTNPRFAPKIDISIEAAKRLKTKNHLRPCKASTSSACVLSSVFTLRMQVYSKP